MKLSILLAGVSLLASEAMAGGVSNVAGTLDATLVDPPPGQYPHFICASGCSGGGGGGGGGGGAVTQSGAWTVGISNFPATQTVNGTVSVAGGATSANQPSLNADGGGLAHITNFPAIQAVNGTVSVGNLPAVQTVNGSVSIANLPATQPVTGTISVGNFPASQAVTGAVSVPGVATAANQPTLNADGGALAHVTDWPALQAVSGSVTVSNLPATQAVSGTVSVGNFPSTQTVTGTIAVPGVATAANQPTLDGDGGGLAHVTNWPATQSVNGSVTVGNFPATQAVSGTVTIGTSVGFGAVGNPSLYVETVQGVANGTPLSVNMLDGADATLGSMTDAAAGVGSASVVSLLKQIHLDSSGPLPAGANTVGVVNLGAQTVFNTPVKSATWESAHVFKSAGGQLTSAYVVSSVAGYLMVFDSATVPPDGAVSPAECIPVPPNVASGISFSGLPPEAYANGISAVFSTTGCFTKTSSPTAFFHGAVQ